MPLHKKNILNVCCAIAGLCLNCLPGQPGEFVGKIVSNHPSRSFDGYVDKEATEKKIVRDVLHKGDMWFRYVN